MKLEDEYHTARLVLLDGEPPTLEITCIAPIGGECNAFMALGGSRQGQRVCDVLNLWSDTGWEAFETGPNCSEVQNVSNYIYNAQFVPLEFKVTRRSVRYEEMDEEWFQLEPKQ